MKRLLKAGIFLAAVMVMVSGCSGQKEAKEEEPSQGKYPISLGGKEILVGETTVQMLLDQELRVTVSEMTEDKQVNQYEIDAEQELEPNTYYTGGTIWITDSIFAQISMVTGEESSQMGDAVIASLEFSLFGGEASELEQIAFNGVPVSEISREKAGEMFPDFEGDENMWFQYGSDYEYLMTFDSEDGMLNKVSLTKEYDVDWNTSP